MSSTPTPTPSAARRRSKNALLVLVAVIAAIGITTIVNYVVYWQYRGMSPDARRWVRYDLTSTRRYSLAPQSRGVLDSLTTQHRLVTMLGGETMTPDQQQRIRDLIDEYARASEQLEVKHIDLDSQAGERDSLLAEMDAMFAEDTAPIRRSISDGLEKLNKYEELVDQIESSLRTIVDSGVEMRPASIQNQRLTDLHSQYLRLQDQASQIRENRSDMLGNNWQTRLKTPGGISLDSADQGAALPDYTLLMSSIQRYAIQLAQTLADTPAKADQLYRGIVVNQLAEPKAQETALKAQNTLAALVQQVPQLQKQLKPQLDALLTVTPPHRYEDARSVLNDKPCVLTTSEGDARVIPAELLFRGSGTSEEGTTSDLFVGEEQLTGALISMQLEPPPLVVFVRSNIGLRALSVVSADQQRLEGIYDHVTARLLSMDFEVAEWVPNKAMDNAPQPRKGQAVVWVTMPYRKPDSRYPESLKTEGKARLATFLKEKMNLGHGVLMMLGANPDTDPRFKHDEPADPLVHVLSQMGIDAQVYQSAVRLESEDADGKRKVYSNAFLVRRWPDSVVAGDALNGIDTYLTFPMPIETATTQGVKHIRLVELSAPVMHVQREAADRETGEFTPEPDSSRNNVVVGVAAQRGDARLITIGDALWAMDEIVSAAVLPDGTSGPGLADKPGARILYPGNSDLFVNCVCWLAHEEDLIAASPRTQDIRRIKAISPATIQTYRVLLWGGMPAAIFVVGVVVWLMRRRA